MRRFLIGSSTLLLALAVFTLGPGGQVRVDATIPESATTADGGSAVTVLTGTFLGGQPSAESFLVGIKQGDWRDLPEGSSFDVHQLSTGSVQISENAWAVSLDASAIPERFVAPDGQVDFMLQAHDPDTGAAAFHTVSALRLTSTLDGTVDLVRAGAGIPEGYVALPGLSSLASNLDSKEPTSGEPPSLGSGTAGTDELEAGDASSSSVSVAELQGIPLEFIAAPADVAEDEGKTGDTSFLLATPPAARVSMQSAPWNCNEISGYRRSLQTTIATGYPVGGDTSSLTYSASMKTTSGSATSFGGAWSESGSETTTDGWGADFYQDSRKRSYRTVITYGYYRCYNVAGYYSYWVFPIKQPGDAYYYYLSSKPNWTRCSTVYNGITWKRDRTDQNDYEWKFGVKAKEYIGFEMYSRHGYSTGSKLRYHVTHGNKRVCGNNNTPGQAGKVQEKY